MDSKTKIECFYDEQGDETEMVVMKKQEVIITQYVGTCKRVGAKENSKLKIIV